ncbi:MAG TPA: DUF1549 and DUF1553 domain-containing protein, partial [Candidatus Limnocylindria bacterium]|nr:DUF1549 and DUF1553 domain-containing protein [Candidatus Limnocylindria bacterium]
FVFAQLKKKGLRPSPEANRITLARRASLDLTGLPPSPEEVDAFVNDTSSDAWEKYVDRLFASPRYGEKWARWWLDAARYADSNGFEKDRTRSIWPWRDWVINAFNTGMSFDRFTVEQLAGDLLPHPTIDQRIATGFLRNSMVNMEGGIEPEKFRVEAIIDRVDCVGRTWLGLTISCAQCHSHKFDPISQTEYYRFYSFLNQDDEPKIDVPNATQQAKRDTIIQSAAEFEQKLTSEIPDFESKLATWETSIQNAQGDWQPIDPREWHSTPMKFEKLEDLSFLGGGDIFNNGVFRFWADTQLTNITGFRLEALTHPNLPFNGPGIDGNGQFQVCEFTVEATPLSELKAPEAGSTTFRATTNTVVFNHAEADAWSPGWEPAGLIDGNSTNGGWAVDFTYGRRNTEHRAVMEATQPVGFAGGTRLLISIHSKPKDSKLSNYHLGRFRLSLTTQNGPLHIDPLTPGQRKILDIPRTQRTVGQQRELVRAYLFSDPSMSAQAQKWDELWKDWPKAENTTLALTERFAPRHTRLFKRGDWTRPMEEVHAGIPAVLPQPPAGAPESRLTLAHWLVSTNNPLTARVIANRVWQVFFGQGLVTTPEDFGTRADAPSHPELLDWFAQEFMRPTWKPKSSSRTATVAANSHEMEPWSIRHLQRLIVTSATYKQSSVISPELLEKDPYNHLLARGPRFRVDAETIQDIALKTAGLLSTKVGGPSVFPPLPDGVMQLAYNQIAWNVSEGDDRYRRAMYTFWKRSVPYPALTTFDAPTAEQSCVRRVRSNTPLQALITLNEPTMINAARWLGYRTLTQGGLSDTNRINFAFRQVLNRRPDAQESAALLRLLGTAQSEFKDKPKDAANFAWTDPKNPAPLPEGTDTTTLAAWAAVSRALLNLDETVTKE